MIESVKLGNVKEEENIVQTAEISRTTSDSEA